MSARSLHYFNGNEVHVGDRVAYNGVMGTVVFVTDGDGGEFAPGYEDYQGHDPGMMFSDDDGDLTFLAEAGEGLEFVRRANTQFT